jgi:hypothetical protein
MLYYLPLHESLVVIKNLAKSSKLMMIPSFMRQKVLKFPSRYLWLATLKLGMKQGILEAQTRPQREGEFECSFKKYLDMEGDLNSQSLTIVYGILYCRAVDIRYLPRRLIRSLYTIHAFCARLQNALLRPSAAFSLPRSCCWFFFGWVWKARRGGGPPEPPFVFFFLVKEGFVFF